MRVPTVKHAALAAEHDLQELVDKVVIVIRYDGCLERFDTVLEEVVALKQLIEVSDTALVLGRCEDYVQIVILHVDQLSAPLLQIPDTAIAFHQLRPDLWVVF